MEGQKGQDGTFSDDGSQAVGKPGERGGDGGRGGAGGFGGHNGRGVFVFIGKKSFLTKHFPYDENYSGLNGQDGMSGEPGLGGLS